MCMCVKSFSYLSNLFLSLCSVVHYARDCSCTHLLAMVCILHEAYARGCVLLESH